jgi:hypothetical protein
MKPILSAPLSPTALLMMPSSCVFETPVVPDSAVKRRSSERLCPPLLKRKREHSYCPPVGVASAVSPYYNSNSGNRSSSRLPMLDISDFQQAMPQDDDVDAAALPMITLRPRATRLFDEQGDCMIEPQQPVIYHPRLSLLVVPASPLPEQDHEPQDKECRESSSEAEESVSDEASSTTTTTRRPSFSYPITGTPLLKRSLSLQFSLRRLSIGSCNSLNAMASGGCTVTPATPAAPTASDGLDLLSIPSLDDDINDNNMNKTKTPPALAAQPPQAKRGTRNVFDYLATALRLPDVALGV